MEEGRTLVRRKFGIAPLREGAYQTKRARGDGGTGTWSPPDESTQIRRQAMCKLRLEQNSSAVGAIECAETLVARHKAQVGVGSGKIRGRGLPQHRLAGMTVTTRMRMALRTVVATATDARGGGVCSTTCASADSGQRRHGNGGRSRGGIDDSSPPLALIQVGQRSRAAAAAASRRVGLTTKSSPNRAGVVKTLIQYLKVITQFFLQYLSIEGVVTSMTECARRVHDSATQELVNVMSKGFTQDRAENVPSLIVNELGTFYVGATAEKEENAQETANGQKIGLVEQRRGLLGMLEEVAHVLNEIYGKIDEVNAEDRKSRKAPAPAHTYYTRALSLTSPESKFTPPEYGLIRSHSCSTEHYYRCPLPAPPCPLYTTQSR